MTIGMAFYNNLAEADMATTSTGALASGDPLFTSAVVCLFTRRQVDARGGVLPNVSQGWYGDTFRPRPLGSRLWTLRDAKLDVNTLRLAQVYAYEALSWWVPKKVVKTLEITTAEVARDRFSLTVKVTRPDGGPWQHVWQEVALSGL